jgi:hypothetical protein
MMLRTCILLMLLAAQIPNQQPASQHAALGQPDKHYFAYQRPLSISSTSGQTCAVIDPTILMHSAPGMPDVRIYSGDQQVPYAMRTSSPPPPRQELAQILNLGVRGGTVAFDAEMPEGKYSTIQLDIYAKNFVTTVDVSGSASAAGDRATKLGTYTIFDLTGEKLDRSTVLHLPESNFRYLHFKVHAPIKPHDVDGITIAGEAQEDVVYSTIAVTSTMRQEGHWSVFDVAIPANVPVDRVEFVPGPTPENFSRGVSVTWRSKISADKNPEPAASQHAVFEKGRIRRIHSVHDGHRIDDEQFAIDPRYAPDSLPTQMMISILNGDDVPLEITTVYLQMRERKLCFDAVAGANYMLYYGDGELRSPEYDYASLFVPEEHPAAATFGVERPNPLLQPRPDRRPLTERYPALLWIALLAVIAILGLIALRTARRMHA